MSAAMPTHPFTSLTSLAAATTLLLPAETALVYSAAASLSLLLFRATRRENTSPVFSGHWPVAGPRRLVYPVAGRPTPRPARWAKCHHAWLRILAIASTSQLWMEYVPVQRFIRALFSLHACRRASLISSPGSLLVVEQPKRQLTRLPRGFNAPAAYR